MAPMDERLFLADCRIQAGGGFLNAIPRIFVLILCVFAAGAAVSAGRPAAAQQAESVYAVSGVAVDRTAGTAADAREQALAAGHVAAFGRLLDRIVPRDRRAALPALDAAAVAPFVLSFGIDEEKTSDVRYLARLTFQFRRSEVREFVRANGASVAETRSKPALVLPVYSEAGALALWDDPNPWLAAWKRLPSPDGLVPLRVPAGDLADIRDISAEQAARGEEAALEKIADRYGVSGVIVARAALAVDPGTARRTLSVATSRSGSALGDRTAVRSFVLEEGETVEAVCARAARALAAEIEEDWKSENLLRFDRQGELVAVLSVGDLREWVSVRARIREVAALRQSQMMSASRDRIVVRLSYYGDPEQLRVALAQKDLVLEQGAVNWILREAAEDPGETQGDSGGAPQGNGGSR
jgi:hypothetical protein